MMADKEVKLIDTELLRTNIAQIAKACAKSDKQKALVGRILFMVENMPTIEAEPVSMGRWEEKHYMEMKWIPSRFDDVSPEDVDIEPMVELKCSKCHLWSVNFRNHIELKYCPMCGARMDGDSE